MFHRPAVVSLLALCLSSLSAAAEEPATVPGFKRMQQLSDEDLRKQLQVIPELGFDQAAATVVLTPMLKAPKDSKAAKDPAQHDYGQQMYSLFASSLKRPDMLLLPWRAGLDSQMGKESAERLDVLSNNLRRYLREATPSNDIRPDVGKLRDPFSRAGSNLEVCKPI